MHTYNPNTPRPREGGPSVQGQLEQYSKNMFQSKHENKINTNKLGQSVLYKFKGLA